MVASLQSKKEALEAKLRDRTKELKKLCFEEAELTGILPPETPLEPGESPPQFRRRVGTAFTFPENLIDQLQSKEDKAIASLELDCKIQTGIAEAALGIANDSSSSKSVRRKHKVIYLESQKRLFELESELNNLKQSQARLSKKNNSNTLEADIDCVDGEERDLNRNNLKQTAVPHVTSEHGVPLRHNYAFSTLPRHDNALHPGYRTVQYYPTLPNNYYLNAGTNYKQYLLPDNHPYYFRSPCVTPVDPCWHGPKERDFIPSSQPVNESSPDQLAPDINFTSTRHVIERNTWSALSNDNENRLSSTLPRNVCNQPHAATVLLPGQTYPDNSLMRTQSLGNVGSYPSSSERKKEKEWYETSLDSSPVPPRMFKHEAQETVEPPLSKTSTLENPVDEGNDLECTKAHHALINNVQFDTVVPYESPKNHTVIEAGKWQPYREITKPFEMSDFYKYSTKYRKGKTSPASSVCLTQDRASQQQKVVYKPLQPQECQPLSNRSLSDNLRNIQTPSNEGVASGDNYPWYSDKRPVNTSSATLV